MKTHIPLIIAALMAASTAQAASLERVGAKVAGASAFVPAILFVSPQHGAVTITTEDMARGRAIEGAEVVPAGSFDPTSARSAVAYIQARFGVTPGLTGLGGSLNVAPTATTPGERDSDRW